MSEEDDAHSETTVNEEDFTYTKEENEARKLKKAPLSEPYFYLQCRDPSIHRCALNPKNENLFLSFWHFRFFLFDITTRANKILKKVKSWIYDAGFSYDGEYFHVSSSYAWLGIYQTSSAKPVWQCDDVVKVVWHPTENVLFIILRGHQLCVLHVPEFKCSFLSPCSRENFYTSTNGTRFCTYLEENHELHMWDFDKINANFLFNKNKVYRYDGSSLQCVIAMKSVRQQVKDIKLNDLCDEFQPASPTVYRVIKLSDCNSPSILALDEHDIIAYPATQYVKFISISDGSPLAEVKCTNETDYPLELFADGGYIAAANNDGIHVISLMSFNVHWSFDTAYKLEFKGLSWCAGDNVLVFYRNGYAKLMNITEKKEIQTYHCHRRYLRDYAFFRDKKKFLTVGSEGTIRVFKI